MSTKNTNLLLASLILLSLIAGVILLPLLPDQIASHWNARGEVDSYMPKVSGTFLFPAILIGLYIFYTFIPKIDPLKINIESFRKYYNMFWVIITFFLVYIFAISMAWNLGLRLNVGLLIAPGLAILFYTVGVLLGKTKRNWFVGIRTPWTLSNDIVWEKTHKLGEKLFKITAILTVVSMFFGGEAMIWFMIIPAISASLITIVYSYFEHRRQTR